MWRKWAFRNENPSVEIKNSMDGLNASFDIAHGALERRCISRSYSRRVGRTGEMRKGYRVRTREVSWE